MPQKFIGFSNHSACVCVSLHVLFEFLGSRCSNGHGEISIFPWCANLGQVSGDLMVSPLGSKMGRGMLKWSNALAAGYARLKWDKLTHFSCSLRIAELAESWRGAFLSIKLLPKGSKVSLIFHDVSQCQCIAQFLFRGASVKRTQRSISSPVGIPASVWGAATMCWSWSHSIRSIKCWIQGWGLNSQSATCLPTLQALQRCWTYIESWIVLESHWVADSHLHNGSTVADCGHPIQTAKAVSCCHQVLSKPLGWGLWSSCCVFWRRECPALLYPDEPNLRRCLSPKAHGPTGYASLVQSNFNQMANL